jgi:hypothetical protein
VEFSIEAPFHGGLATSEVNKKNTKEIGSGWEHTAQKLNIPWLEDPMIDPNLAAVSTASKIWGSSPVSSLFGSVGEWKKGLLVCYILSKVAVTCLCL